MESTRTIDDKIIWRDLSPLIAPRSVAIVGASQRGADANLAREPRGNRVIRNLRNFGFTGRIVTVNPKYTEIMGYPCYPDIASMPEPVDCLVSAVPNRHVPDLLESAANPGCARRWCSPPVSARLAAKAKSDKRGSKPYLKSAAFSSAAPIVTAS